ncbi:MAG: O-antigen ligase family protein [Anaerolineales bacterium]
MNRESLFLESTDVRKPLKKVGWSRNLVVILLILGMILAGLGLAYLVATGNWLIAVGIVCAIPALITLIRYPLVTLVIWLVLSPFLVQTPSTAERAVYWLVHRFLPLLTLTIMLLSSTLRISKRQLPRFGLPEYAMLGYLVVTVTSVIIQNNSVFATLILFYDRIFIPMCLYWVVKLSAPSEKALKWLVPIAVYIIASQVVIGTISWIMPSALPSYWTKYAGERTTGSLNSVSVFTATITFAGVFVLYTALRMKRGWKRSFLLLVFVSTIYGIIISFSRASWLAGLLLLFGVYILYPRFVTRLMLRLLPVILLLGGTVLVNQIQHAEERFYSKDSAHTALSRLPVLVAAYRMFEAKPIFGWGYANFDRYDRQFQGRFGDLVNPDEKDHTSHNMYLTLLAEQGVVGFILLQLPVLWLLFRTIKLRSTFAQKGLKSRNMTYLLWLVYLSFFIVMNFAPIVVVFGLGLYWVTLGLISNNLQSYSRVK